MEHAAFVLIKITHEAAPLTAVAADGPPITGPGIPTSGWQQMTIDEAAYAAVGGEHGVSFAVGKNYCRMWVTGAETDLQTGDREIFINAVWKGAIPDANLPERDRKQYRTGRDRFVRWARANDTYAERYRGARVIVTEGRIGWIEMGTF